MMIMLLSGLQTVPEDLKEAAEIDGAHRTAEIFMYHGSLYHAGCKDSDPLHPLFSNFQMFVLFFTMTRRRPGKSHDHTASVHL